MLIQCGVYIYIYIVTIYIYTHNYIYTHLYSSLYIFIYSNHKYMNHAFTWCFDIELYRFVNTFP